jgi:hypothetical protein
LHSIDWRFNELTQAESAKIAVCNDRDVEDIRQAITRLKLIIASRWWYRL